LLSAAGIIKRTTESEKTESTEWEKRIAFYTGELTEDQKNMVVNYIKFIKSDI
jgi:hypothetical protein